MFRIFALHTTIDKAKGTLPIDSIETENLPKADYYAMGHLHIDFKYKNFVYPGPLFPNNFQELEDLRFGGFYLVDTESANPLEKIKIKIKDILTLKFEFKDTLGATDKIISELNKNELTDKIVLLRIEGELENGKNSDIKFQQIEEFAKERGAYFVLRNTHGLNTKEIELEREIRDSENVEKDAIKIYAEENPAEFNDLVPQLINSLQTEKQEGETSEVFTTRLMEEARKILGI
jgi:DNA repair exonuclease SbcCD nuclease subunit